MKRRQAADRKDKEQNSWAGLESVGTATRIRGEGRKGEGGRGRERGEVRANHTVWWQNKTNQNLVLERLVRNKLLLRDVLWEESLRHEVPRHGAHAAGHRIGTEHLRRWEERPRDRWMIGDITLRIAAAAATAIVIAIRFEASIRCTLRC